MKIGIISDTHNVLRNDVLEELQTCDYILHAGDIMKEEILEKLKKTAPLIVVKGNNDYLMLNEEEYFTLAGYRFYMVHQIGEKKDVDFYIYGQSHRYECYIQNGVQYLNPGSCGRKRFSLPLTYIILILNPNGYEIIQKDVQ